jgi:hypothetical protein
MNSPILLIRGISKHTYVKDLDIGIRTKKENLKNQIVKITIWENLKKEFFDQTTGIIINQ